MCVCVVLSAHRLLRHALHFCPLEHARGMCVSCVCGVCGRARRREAARRPGAQAASRMQAQAPARGAPPVRVTRGLTPRVVAFSIFSRDVWSQRFIIPRKHSTQYVLSSQCSDTESHFDSTTMGPSHDCDIVFSTDFRKVSSDCTRLGAASSKAPTLPLLSRARVGEGGGTGQAWHMGHMVHDRAWEARGWVG